MTNPKAIDTRAEIDMLVHKIVSDNLVVVPPKAHVIADELRKLGYERSTRQVQQIIRDQSPLRPVTLDEVISKVLDDIV